MDEIDKAGESFMGMLRADEPDAAYFLFFLREVLMRQAASETTTHADKHKDFMQHISTDTSEETPLHKTDPVLLKGMLVFLQRSFHKK